MTTLQQSIGVCTLMAASFVASAVAAPQHSGLLALVPANAQIVAGIEDPHNPDSHGRLLLVTHNDNLDYEDCVSITGVDSHRRVEEVIEAAATSERGELAEHLVLLAGRFDQKRVFKAARQNSARLVSYKGNEILVVDPLPRELNAMRDVRWLAILNDEVAIFGTQQMVSQVIDRAAERADIDPALAEKISRLRSDVNSWDVLAMPSDMLARHFELGRMDAAWTAVLDSADEVELGIRYGGKARVDFAVHSASQEQTRAIAALFQKPRLLLAAAGTRPKAHLTALSVNGARVEGSIALPGNEFDNFLESFYRSRSEDS